MLITYTALMVGTLVAVSFYAFAGRLAAVGVLTIWSAATAYFLMTPIYSFRVSSWSDLAALALYGTVGLVLAGTSGPARQRRSQAETPASAPNVDFVDVKSVVEELKCSSELGADLRRRQVEVEASTVQRIRVSRSDMLLVLSDVLTAVLADPQLRRVSIQTGRQPGVEMLFVDSFKVWPPPLQTRIAIGQCVKDCAEADFATWPAHLNATWFDNECGRVYQISIATC